MRVTLAALTIVVSIGINDAASDEATWFCPSCNIDAVGINLDASMMFQKAAEGNTLVLKASEFASAMANEHPICGIDIGIDIMGVTTFCLLSSISFEEDSDGDVQMVLYFFKNGETEDHGKLEIPISQVSEKVPETSKDDLKDKSNLFLVPNPDMLFDNLNKDKVPFFFGWLDDVLKHGVQSMEEDEDLVETFVTRPVLLHEEAMTKLKSTIKASVIALSAPDS